MEVEIKFGSMIAESININLKIFLFFEDQNSYNSFDHMYSSGGNTLLFQGRS